MLTTLTRSRLLRLLAIGGVLYAADAWRGPTTDPDRAPIVVSAAEVDAAVDAFTRKRSAPPTPAERQALVDELVADELLYRHGVALGLAEGSAIARRRTEDLAGFLELGDGHVGVEQVDALGIAGRDPIVRRHVVQVLRLALRQPTPENLPSEAELRAYLAAEGEAFTRPARARVTHVFLAGGRRGERAEADARALRQRLQADGTAPDAAVAAGDPFMAGHALSLRTERELGRAFGAEAAAQVMALPARTWSEPIASPYGWHLVWVHEQADPYVPALGRIRGQVLHHYLAERADERLGALLAELRERYDVQVEATEATG